MGPPELQAAAGASSELFSISHYVTDTVLFAFMSVLQNVNMNPEIKIHIRSTSEPRTPQEDPCLLSDRVTCRYSSGGC